MDTHVRGPGNTATRRHLQHQTNLRGADRARRTLARLHPPPTFAQMRDPH